MVQKKMIIKNNPSPTFYNNIKSNITLSSDSNDQLMDACSKGINTRLVTFHAKFSNVIF